MAKQPELSGLKVSINTVVRKIFTKAPSEKATMHPTESFYSRNSKFEYLSTYDHSSGRKSRYTLMILTSEDPVVIGREVTKTDIKRIVKEFELANVDIAWFGDRKSALKAVKRWRP